MAYIRTGEYVSTGATGEPSFWPLFIAVIVGLGWLASKGKKVS